MAVLEVRTEVVRPGLNAAVLAAVEAQALGGLVVLLRAAGLDVVAARERPRVVVMIQAERETIPRSRQVGVRRVGHRGLDAKGSR